MSKPSRKQVRIALAIVSGVLRIVAERRRDGELSKMREHSRLMVANQRETLNLLNKLELRQTALEKRLDRAGALGSR